MIKTISPLLFGVMLLAGAPASAADEHHPADGAAPPSQSMNVPGPPIPTGGMMSMTGNGAIPMMGMMTDHIEGRLAFLKAELKVTAAQEKQWSTFAETVRASATAMTGVREGMMQARSGSLPARIDETEKALTACLRTIEKIKAVVAPLYAGFSDEQKRAADQLMMSPMGPMGMMQ